jgi:hypothetical protein
MSTGTTSRTGTRTAALQRRASHSLGGLGRAAPPGAGSTAFPWLVTATSAWILVGLFVDGWFHINSPGLETFFTPWHALLYSGVAAALVVHLREQVRAGGLPPGYRLSLVGGLVVSLAGLVDMVWHTVLGVEADLAALLSPPHLLLITAGTLVFAGPLRAACAPRPGAGRAAHGASRRVVVTGLGFFTQYSNPFTQVYPSARRGASLEVRELRECGRGRRRDRVRGADRRAVAVLKRGHPGCRASSRSRSGPSLFLVTQQDTYSFVAGDPAHRVLVELAGRRLSRRWRAARDHALTTGWVLTSWRTRDVAWSRSC